MTKRERPTRPVTVPASIAPLIAERSWKRDTVGESGAALYRLAHPEHPALYLKHGQGTVADAVTDEMARLRWLEGRLPVPEVRCFVAVDDQAWLLMTAIPGRTAYQSLSEGGEDSMAIVDALAAFLRRVHALPAEECPFDSGHLLRLGQARERLDAGLIDESDFDAEREGWSAQQVWDELTALLPLIPDPVVTHGDFSLDNILMQGGEVVGCIDVGRTGVANRYQDLAILWNCLGEFGAPLQDRLFAAYGIDAPDARELRFHLALDECF